MFSSAGTAPAPISFATRGPLALLGSLIAEEELGGAMRGDI